MKHDGIFFGEEVVQSYVLDGNPVVAALCAAERDFTISTAMVAQVIAKKR